MAKSSKKAVARAVMAREEIAGEDARSVGEVVADVVAALPAPQTKTAESVTGAENGAVLFIPLNKLRKSPRNARKTPHSEAHIEALAASIGRQGGAAHLRSHNPHRDRDGRGSNNRTEQDDNGNHRHLHAQRDRFVGTVKTLTLNVKARFVPTESDNERGPAYRIVAAATEFGAAWKKTSRETGREYLSVKLDDPSFPAPIYASSPARPSRGRVRHSRL